MKIIGFVRFNIHDCPGAEESWLVALEYRLRWGLWDASKPWPEYCLVQWTEMAQ